MNRYDTFIAQVQACETIEQSVIAFLQGVSTRIQALADEARARVDASRAKGTDLAEVLVLAIQLTALVSYITTSQNQLAAALTTNTPTPPPPNVKPAT
jgi:hypothetical protein